MEMVTSPPPHRQTLAARDRGDRLNVRRYSRTYAVLAGLRAAIERIVERDLPEFRSLTLVDYGCGNMPYRPLFEARGVKYMGADLPGNEMAEALITPDGRVDLPDGRCEIVLSTQVLEHVLAPHAYLTECGRLLRPGGRVIISTHGYWRYHPDPTDFWRWTGDGLRRQIEQAGLRIVRVEGVVGLAGAGLQLFQDALYPRLWTTARAPFALVMQALVRLFDRLHAARERADEALVIVAIAEKPVARST
jgi:SAM-dependent methyltransferase